MGEAWSRPLWEEWQKRHHTTDVPELTFWAQVQLISWLNFRTRMCRSPTSYLNITLLAFLAFLHGATRTIADVKNHDARIVLALFFRPADGLTMCSRWPDPTTDAHPLIRRCFDHRLCGDHALAAMNSEGIHTCTRYSEVKNGQFQPLLAMVTGSPRLEMMDCILFEGYAGKS